jgi:hypothetical protein
MIARRAGARGATAGLRTPQDSISRGTPLPLQEALIHEVAADRSILEH